MRLFQAIKNAVNAAKESPVLGAAAIGLPISVAAYQIYTIFGDMKTLHEKKKVLGEKGYQRVQVGTEEKYNTYIVPTMPGIQSRIKQQVPVYGWQNNKGEVLSEEEVKQYKPR